VRHPNALVCSLGIIGTIGKDVQHFFADCGNNRVFGGQHMCGGQQQKFRNPPE
jgi:hypothetical protein